MLAGVLLAGTALRVVATASIWPINADLDAASYAQYADAHLFEDPLHPVGYSAFLVVVGVVTREVAVYGLLQHALGIAAALLMFGAVRRLTGSPWPALVGAAAVLLNSDVVFLERAIMSEALFVPMLAATLYAAARVIDDPQRWGWVIATGVLAGLTTVVRTTGIFLLLVLLVAILLSRPRPWRPRWGQPAAILAIAGTILCAYGFANLAANDRFEVAPTPGWHLYARVAPIADCSQFTPPEDTDVLCETIPFANRQGSEFYLVDPASPAYKLADDLGDQDSKFGAFAREAILAQPRTYLDLVYDELKRFYVPSSYPYRPASGGDLDPQLDWSAPSGWTPEKLQRVDRVMERFFNPFSMEKSRGGLGALHDYKEVARFGGTLLSITTLLFLIGLLVGPRRSRVTALLLGGTGLMLLIPPAVSANYVGRYVVPAAAPLMAAAAVAIWTLWRMEGDRRRASAGAAAATRP